MSTSIITSRAVSLPNPHGYAPGLPFDFVVTYPAGYDLANAWQKISFSATSDGDPLFTITEDSSEISVSGQVLSINIDPATANEIAEGDDFSTVWGASHQLFFAVEVGPTSTPTVGDYRIQGKAERLPVRGPFAETGRNSPYTLTLGTDAITVSVAGQGAKGDDGDPGPGLPAGGTVGQIPTKASSTDYDVEWSNAGAGDMVAANNLSELTDAAAARTNLGLGTAATFDTGDFATAAQGTTADTAIQPADISGLTGGTTGQIATKTSGDDYDLTWSDDLTVPGLLTADHIHGNIAGTLYIHVKNTSGGTLTKGTPVYVTGHVGVSDRAEVQAADQSNAAKMPAIALLAQDLLNNGEGDAVIVGEIRTFDTVTPGWAINDELFVGTSGLTSTRPTSGAVQPIATVGRLHASTGVLVINCQGQRSPDETFATAAQGAKADTAQQPPAEGAFVDGDKTKLDGIEAGADVTDTANVTAAGALMDSEVTNLAAVKAFDPTAYATASQGAKADSAIQPGDIDTLAEVNAIITDATLIDTTDSRLSDSRTCDNTFDDAATARTNLGVDPAGTDNSTDVTLAGTLDYLSLAGQEITLGSVDLTTDITGTLPEANGGTGVTSLGSLDAASLGAGASTDGQVLTSDGAGGAAWEGTATEIGIACSDETTDLSAATGVATFRMPYAMTLTDVRASVTTAPVGSTLIVDINESGSTILGTKLSIDASEKTSETAATPAVISDSALADDAEITIDIDQVGSTTAGAGLKIWLIGTRA